MKTIVIVKTITGLTKRALSMEKEAKESARETLAARALKILGVIKYDKDCHTIIDVSLLQSLPENEMLRCRGVGKITLGMILELKRATGWTDR